MDDSEQYKTMTEDEYEITRHIMAEQYDSLVNEILENISERVYVRMEEMNYTEKRITLLFQPEHYKEQSYTAADVTRYEQMMEDVGKKHCWNVVAGPYLTTIYHYEARIGCITVAYQLTEHPYENRDVKHHRQLLRRHKS